MALKIKKYNIYGVQFHPESIASQYGKLYLKTLLNYVKRISNMHIIKYFI